MKTYVNNIKNLRDFCCIFKSILKSTTVNLTHQTYQHHQLKRQHINLNNLLLLKN